MLSQLGMPFFPVSRRLSEKADGSHKYYGRFNQGVVTINLVDVACSSEGDMDRFWEILDERLELCHEALRCRHERLLGTISDVAPILWQNGALARLKRVRRSISFCLTDILLFHWAMQTV